MQNKSVVIGVCCVGIMLLLLMMDRDYSFSPPLSSQQPPIISSTPSSSNDQHHLPNIVLTRSSPSSTISHPPSSRGFFPTRLFEQRAKSSRSQKDEGEDVTATTTQSSPRRHFQNDGDVVAGGGGGGGGVVAICFFGLVKNMRYTEADAFRRNLYEPLWNRGYSTRTIVHTYKMKEFFNPRNNEKGDNAPKINQSKSLEILKNAATRSGVALSSAQQRTASGGNHSSSSSSTSGGEKNHQDKFEVHFSNPEDADRFFPPIEEFLKHGDPWPENPKLSVKYYLRQQYSLLQLSHLLEQLQQEKNGSHHEASSRSKSSVVGAVFLRPDLLLYDDMDVDMFDFITSSSSSNPAAAKMMMTPYQQHKQHRSSPRYRIALPSWFLYFDTGFNDRFAYGDVDSMILYSSRGSHLAEYAKKKQPHAEAYLKEFLCARNVEVHLVRTRLGRVRLHGVHGPDSAGGLMRLSAMNEQRWISHHRYKKMAVLCPKKMWKRFGQVIL